MTDKLVTDFADLFQGRTDAFGTGKGQSIQRPLTIEDYRRHLEGLGTGLGIYPLRDDDMVRFGAIDLDEPNFELARAMQSLVPGTTWIERSRSGNAHVWAFFSGPTPAWAVKGILRKATLAVDMPHVEVFPKQEAIRPPARFGNYINLPYHGESRPVIQMGDDGRAVPWTLEAFLQEAPRARNDPDDWVRRAQYLGIHSPSEAPDDGIPFGESPVLHECALHIIEHREDNPLREGGRAVVLFNLSVQLLNYRDMTEREAWELVNMVNDAALPPLDQQELRTLFNNAARGGYKRTGCDDPLMQPYVHPDCPIANGRTGR